MYASVILLLILLSKTQWDVTLHAMGEQPRAADTAGIEVEAVRYFSCTANGILGGLGGSYLTLGKMGFFQENITSGKGYIALVAVILGKLKPLGVLVAALVIGSVQAL